MVVPEACGFKSINWLTHVILSNMAAANDTCIDGNNDIDSPLKTWAATPAVPRAAKANRPIPITGYAQVGISGLTKVHTWVCRQATEPGDAPDSVTAPLVDATIPEPPRQGSWGGTLPEGRTPRRNSRLYNRRKPKTVATAFVQSLLVHSAARPAPRRIHSAVTYNR